LGIVNTNEVVGESLLREDFDEMVVLMIVVRVWGLKTESGNAEEISEDRLLKGGSESDYC
jgi:hypothetical protein